MTAVLLASLAVAAYGAGRRWSPGEWLAWGSVAGMCCLAALAATGGF